MSTWYEKACFYHMYPLGMTGAPHEHTGDAVTNRFEELNQWIPHMKELGCNALYIGPLFESSSHGYDTRDYKLVDRRLGDNEHFIQFVRLCHDAGIRVVVDGVFNHTGREFFAFQDIQKNREHSPYCGWYRGVNFGWNSPYNDGFGYDAWQGHFELPCLNLQNPEVKQYLFDVIRFWVDTFDIDGIRLDCANVLDFQFMKEMRQQTGQMKEEFWLMGEVIHGDYGRWVNDEMLHSVTNYELHKSLYSGLNDHNFFEIAHNVRRLEALGTKLYTFLDNHDENRIASKLNDKAQLGLAYLLLFTLPGIPSIYYGGEWGVEGMRSRDSDAALRPCIPLAEGQALSGELTEFIAKLGQIHTGQPEFHGGRYQELILTNRQYAFARHGEGSMVITAANNDDKESSFSVPVPCKASQAENLMDGTIIPVTDGRLHLTLSGNTGVVLKIRED
ncbi:MAG: alpha-amylase family glycosyl hydrolase [Lachnospiraceae bacterium]|nr:alpha-amylase family glycosyl hydrolase [Lachnospiraceae bacterium]